jgi:hypothetical protein
MTTFLRARNRKRPARYVLVERTNHWRIVDGEFFRDCVIQLPDGRCRVLGVRDDLVAGAA